MVNNRAYVEQQHPMAAQTNPYCPECGQSLTFSRSIPVTRPERSRWWVALAIVIGSYLVATYVVQAGDATQPQRSLTVGCIGVMAILFGLGFLVRRRLSWDRPNRITSAGLRLWTVGENLFFTLFGLSLVGSGYLLALQFGSGSPLTWFIARQTYDRFFEILIYAARAAVDGFIVPGCPCSW